MPKKNLTEALKKEFSLSLDPLNASLIAQLVKNPPALWETWVWSLGWEDAWRRERLPTPVFWPAEFHGLYISPWDCGESDAHFQERLSLSRCKHFQYGRLLHTSLDAELETEVQSLIMTWSPPCMCHRHKQWNNDVISKWQVVFIILIFSVIHLIIVSGNLIFKGKAVVNSELTKF